MSATEAGKAPARHMLVPVSAHFGEDAYHHEFRPSNQDAYLILTLAPREVGWMRTLMQRARALAEDLDQVEGEAGVTPREPLVRWGALPDDYQHASYSSRGHTPDDASPLARARGRAGHEGRAVFVDETLVADLDGRGLLKSPSRVAVRAHGRADRPMSFYLGDPVERNYAPFSYSQLLEAEISWLEGAQLRDRWIELRDLEPMAALRVIRDGPTARLGRAIRADDFLPLLQHGASGVRRQAMMAASELGFEADRNEHLSDGPTRSR